MSMRHLRLIISTLNSWISPLNVIFSSSPFQWVAPPSTQWSKPELFLLPLLQSSFLTYHQVPVIYLLVCMCAKLLQSCLLFVTIWAIAHQAPLSMGFSRQEYWSGLPCSPPGDLPDPGIEPGSLMSPVLAGGFFFLTTSATCEALYLLNPSQKYSFALILLLPQNHATKISSRSLR